MSFRVQSVQPRPRPLRLKARPVKMPDEETPPINQEQPRRFQLQEPIRDQEEEFIEQYNVTTLRMYSKRS